MAKSTLLEVITPSKLFYRDKIELVIVRTLNGDEGFMANHAWAVKLLDTGELWIQEKGSKDFKIAAISGGFVDVKDTITIFTDAAEWPGDIDVSRSKNERERAEKWLEEHKIPVTVEDEKNIDKAKLAILKASNRMNVAEGGRRRKR